MDITTLYKDFSHRINDQLDVLPQLGTNVLNAHPGGHPNSAAWLLWHAGRQFDVQLAALSGAQEVWIAQGYRDELGLGELGDSMGYGHTPDDAAQLVVGSRESAEALVRYIRAVVAAADEYVDGLGADQWDVVVDDSWDPPVSRGTRLVSIVDDAVQHIAQAHYVAGMPELATPA